MPGNNTYSGAVKRSKKVVLFSDSICNRFNEWELNQKFKLCHIKKKTFPGATAAELAEHYMHPHLKRGTPDIALIHIGTNDLLQISNEHGDVEAEIISTICNNIIQCGKVCKQYGTTKVCISSMLPGSTTQFQASVMHINFQLENMCKENGFYYILNKNIVYEKPTYHNMGYFFKVGLHLNASGRQALLENFIKYLDMD